MRNRWMVMCCVVVLAAACGKDENNDSNNSNNDSNNANNVSNNANNSNNASNDPNNSNNVSNDPNNNTNGNTRTEPFITVFSYYVEDDSIGASDGFTVSVVSGDIANRDGNTRAMTAEDATNFEMTYMTAATIDKMRNGWGCPDEFGGDMGTADMGSDMGGDAGMDMGPGNGGDDARHIFEARIQEGDIATEIKNITGCLDANVTEVTTLIEAINALGESYLQ